MGSSALVEPDRTLFASEARFRAFFDLSPFGYLIMSTDQKLVAVNPAACRLTGYDKDELIGQHPSLVVDPSFLEQAQSRFDDGLSASTADRVHQESVWRTKDGRHIDVELSVMPERDAAGRIRQFLVAVQDVSAAKRAVDERQVLLDRVVEAHAEERVRLARELHDGLGQVLTSASLFASSIEEEAPAALGAPLASLRAQLEEALTATRTLVWRLRPVEVDAQGLGGAVAILAEKTRQRHGFEVDAHVSGLDERLAPATASAIYRVVQEAVTNAVRHADPRAISIVITQHGPAIVAVVEDDGAGFVPDRVVRRHGDESGLGLLGMRERAAAAGGRLVVESRPGNGAMVRLEVPCEDEGGR